MKGIIDLDFSRILRKSGAARQVAECIWHMAKKYPAAKSVVVAVYIDRDDLHDRYGNAVTEDLFMTNIYWKDLSDVRKFQAPEYFRDEGSDAFGQGIPTTIIMSELTHVPGANFLDE